MVKSSIQGSMNNKLAEVVGGDEKNALVVATRPLKSYFNKLSFFSNPNYGNALNQDASAGGTPEQVHNGTDTVLWTGSSITGVKVTFNSTDQNHTPAGTQSVRVDNPSLGDIFQFAKGSDIDCNNYITLTFWIYIDKDYSLGDVIEVYGYDSATASKVGNSVDIKSYFQYGDFAVWQKASIPLVDLGISTSTIVDSLRFEIISATGKTPKFYLDDIQFEESGNPIVFSVEPVRGSWLHVVGFSIIYVDEFDSRLLSNSMPVIPYHGFFGLSGLGSGMVYRRIQGQKILSSYAIKSHIDLMSFSNATVSGCGSDGVYSWASVNIDFDYPAVLKSEDNDALTLTITEDFSPLVSLKISVGGYEEIRGRI